MKFKDVNEGMKLTYKGDTYKVVSLVDVDVLLENNCCPMHQRVKTGKRRSRTDNRSFRGSNTVRLTPDLFDLMEWELVKEKRYVTFLEASSKDFTGSMKLRGDSWGLDFQLRYIYHNGHIWCWDGGDPYIPTLADLVIKHIGELE